VTKDKMEDELIERSAPDDNGEGEPEASVIEGEIVTQEIEVIEEKEVDELTALRQQLEATQAQADEYLDDLRRERAAFQNYKKRQESERGELRRRAQVDLLVQLFPILDDMERALETIPDEQADQPWVEGMAFIQRKLQKTLEGLDVVPVEAEAGQSFDPFVHEAVTYEEHQEYEQGKIISVVQKGYRHGERVLRPALVRVAR
jgi:molecular chaperone GrpE